MTGGALKGTQITYLLATPDRMLTGVEVAWKVQSTTAVALTVLRSILSLTVVWPCRGYGRAMVRTMTAACAVPHFHLHDDIAMAKLMQLRRDLQIHSKGQKLTMLPFIIKVQNTSPLCFHMFQSL